MAIPVRHTHDLFVTDLGSFPEQLHTLSSLGKPATCLDPHLVL